MRLRLSQLRRIIKEETKRALREAAGSAADYFGDPGVELTAAQVAQDIMNDMDPDGGPYAGMSPVAALGEWDEANEGKGLDHPFVAEVLDELEKFSGADEDESDQWYSEAMDHINQELGLGPNQAPIKVDFEFAQGAWVAGSDVAEQFGEIRVTKGTIEGRTAMQLSVDAGDWSFYV